MDKTELLNYLENKIKYYDNHISSDKINIACYLALINHTWSQNSSFLGQNYNNFNEYAKIKFGFGRQRVWECLKIAYRFCDYFHNDDGLNQGYKIKKEFKDYSYSQLVLLIKLTDEEIDTLKITPDTSVREIKKLIKDYFNLKLGNSKKGREPPSPWGFDIFEKYGVSCQYKITSDGLVGSDDQVHFKDYRKIGDIVAKNSDFDYFLVRIKKI